MEWGWSDNWVREPNSSHSPLLLNAHRVVLDHHVTQYIVSNAAKGRMTWCVFTPRDTIVSSHPLCSEASSPSTALWCVPGRGLVCCSGLRIYDSILPSMHCRPRITFCFGLLLHVLVVSPEAGKRLQCSGQDPVMQLNPERDA